jgi:hypothetical protein
MRSRSAGGRGTTLGTIIIQSFTLYLLFAMLNVTVGGHLDAQLHVLDARIYPQIYQPACRSLLPDQVRCVTPLLIAPCSLRSTFRSLLLAPCSLLSALSPTRAHCDWARAADDEAFVSVCVQGGAHTDDELRNTLRACQSVMLNAIAGDFDEAAGLVTSPLQRCSTDKALPTIGHQCQHDGCDFGLMSSVGSIPRAPPGLSHLSARA